MKNLTKLIILSICCLFAVTSVSAQAHFDNAGIIYSNTPTLPNTTFGFANFYGGRTQFGMLLGTGYNLSFHLLTEVDKEGNLLLGGKIGYLNEDPYVSFNGVWYANKYLTLSSWDGYGFMDDNPELKGFRKLKFFLAEQKVTFNLWQVVHVNYVLTYYQDKKLHNVGSVKYLPKLSENFFVWTKAGYDFSYGKAVYQLGLVFYPTNTCDRSRK